MSASSTVPTSKTERFGEHTNAFGFLRLLFASLVILSHTPELYDGNRKREILTQIFGTISFGELAVDGFFIISGYLITASFMNSRTPLSYLKKRVARIYPGFLCAYLICVLIVAPLGGAKMPEHMGEVVFIVVRALLLQMPDVGTVFYGTPYAALNGAMWTISIEFKCYLLVFIIGIGGLLNKRSMVLLITILLLAITTLISEDYHPSEIISTMSPAPNMSSLSEWGGVLLGNKKETIRLSSIFLAGSCFYLYREKLVFETKYLLIATFFLFITLFDRYSLNIGIAIFGGYLIFSAAEINRNNFISQINNKNDVSYGLYLYAFPVTKLLLHFYADMNIFVVGIMTFALSYALGWMSWIAVEKPIMSKVRPPKKLSTRPFERDAHQAP